MNSKDRKQLDTIEWHMKWGTPHKQISKKIGMSDKSRGLYQRYFSLKIKEFMHHDED